jgi:hypothetical protein
LGQAVAQRQSSGFDKTGTARIKHCCSTAINDNAMFNDE